MENKIYSLRFGWTPRRTVHIPTFERTSWSLSMLDPSQAHNFIRYFAFSSENLETINDIA